MANTYVQQRIHLVWATLKRQEFLSKEFREPLWAYLGGIVRYHRGVLFAAGGVVDHIHLYAEYPKTVALSQFVNALKSHSSRWLRETYPALSGFRWQTGHAGFSVQRRGEEVLMEYIRNQEIHHLTTDFQAEYLNLLRRHRIDFDPRYVFD